MVRQCISTVSYSFLHNPLIIFIIYIATESKININLKITRLSCLGYKPSNSLLRIIYTRVCREFNQNSNLWETKQKEKTHAKENNHTHKTIFTWFGNLPTFTELQGFHYKIRRYNSAQEHSQETQFPIHLNSLSPTRQENTILSSYAAARLLGIFFTLTACPISQT